MISPKFITDDDIEKEVLSFSISHDCDKEVPLDIENLIEAKLGMDLIPIDGLYSEFGISGFLTSSFDAIYYDSKGNLASRLFHHRFTLAHELGHLVLHRQEYEKLEYSNFEEWLHQQNSILPKNNNYFEIQANKFAGFLLMPTKPFLEASTLLVEKAIVNGFEPNPNNFDTLCPFMAPHIARQFLVSETSATIRLLNCKKLWDMYL